ncbi:MAG: hypothetical protein Q4E57_05400, partial [Eubacteriales bacterium]|nr:hypothetical protein [Eubacteriales bacterium]
MNNDQREAKTIQLDDGGSLVKTSANIYGYAREFKSDVFSMLMNIPKYALSVYNAMNGSNYDDPSLIEIRKLENSIRLSVRNDASFYIDRTFNIYEHQASYCPNMPLRLLKYATDSLLDSVDNKRLLYSRNQIMLPNPHFVVLYNGTEERPAKEILKLSDSYEKQEDSCELELSCTMYNINPGYNDELLSRTQVLSGYTYFVEAVRKYSERYPGNLEQAVSKAIDLCIDNNILAEFFIENRMEVIRVSTIDLTFDTLIRMAREDEREAAGKIIAEKDALISEQEAEIAKLKVLLTYHFVRKLLPHAVRL